MARKTKAEVDAKGPVSSANHTGQYAQGSNNATEGNPRGPSELPKAPRMLLKQVWEDSETREALFENLKQMAQHPKGSAAFLVMSADYLEGKPKQSVEHSVKPDPTFHLHPHVIPAALTPPEEPV